MAQDVEKAKYWWCVMYPENMIDDWKDVISDKLQLPYAYCIHDKCIDSKGELRKVHLHIIIVFPNTTTYNHALKVFKRLEKKGCCAIPNDRFESVINVRKAYDYLIHDTDDCRKKHKHLYPICKRISGNGFDIGQLEQLSSAEKNEMAKNLCNMIIDNGYCNFSDFYMDVMTNFDSGYKL